MFENYKNKHFPQVSTTLMNVSSVKCDHNRPKSFKNHDFKLEGKIMIFDSFWAILSHFYTRYIQKVVKTCEKVCFDVFKHITHILLIIMHKH